MRYIQKRDEPPASIRDWRAAQEQIQPPVNLDYPSFSRKPQLRAELIEEQCGLCAYTGAPLDNRLDGYGNGNGNLVFQPHIEHIKPRSVCRQELEARGGSYGYEICEDMDHRNLVAALEVKRNPPAKVEVFGAAAHGDELLPVTPVQPDCEERFHFDANGGVTGGDNDAMDTIRLLKLDHETLCGWRRGAIDVFFPIDENLTREDLERRIELVSNPAHGKLPEFAFCIKSYAKSILG